MKKYLIFCVLLSLPMASLGQNFKVKPSQSAEEDAPFELKIKDVKQVRQAFEPMAKKESEADKINLLNLRDLQGNKVELNVDRVTVIEYWTNRSFGDNLYWNRMRELEQRFSGSDDIQLVSINYDVVKTGKYHQDSVQKFLKQKTTPKTLYLDMDDGVRHFFYVPGPVAYMLIDHRQQYTHVFRGDDSEGTKLFDELIDNAIKYMHLNRASQTN